MISAIAKMIFRRSVSPQRKSALNLTGEGVNGGH